MKILQINNFHYIRGGSDRVYIDTIDLLEKNGHQVLSFSTLDDRNSSSNYSHYFVSKQNFEGELSLRDKLLGAFKFIYNFEAVQKLESLIKEHRPDIAHLHIFQSRLSSAIIKVLKDNSVPIVMTVHEYKMLCPVYTFLDSKGRICEKCAMNKSYLHSVVNKCSNNNSFKSLLTGLESFIRDSLFSYVDNINHFIMVSNFIYGKHLEYYKIFEKKASILYNFIDLESLKPSMTVVKGDYLLYFGRLSKEKGIMTLLKAIEKLPDVNLKIIGDGPNRKELEDFKLSKNLANVEFLGFMKMEQIKEYVSNCSYVVLPSEWYENNPMTIIESMALRKPIIGANIGGIPELIQNNQNGFLFESGDSESLLLKIKDALTMDYDQYSIISQNARQFAVDNFSSEAYIKKLELIYESLMKY